MKQISNYGIYSLVALLALSVAVISLFSVKPGSRESAGWLTSEESNWLKTNPVITLAPDPDFPPIDFFENGYYIGIAADFISIIEEKTGIQFKIVQMESWESILDAVRNRLIDGIPAAAQTPERKRYIHFTEPFIELPGVIITRSNVKSDLNVNDLNGMKVSVVSGYLWQEFIEADNPGIKLDPVSSIYVGLSKVSMGTSDALIATLPVATYHIEKNGITNLQVSGETGYYTRLSFATRSNLPILNSIVTKTLNQITPWEKKTIIRKWIGLEWHNTAPPSNRLLWLMLVLIFSGSVLVIVVFLFLNLSLKRQVSTRTFELETQLLEIKRIENALRESKEKYDNVFVNAIEAICVLQDGRFKYHNPETARILGYQPQELDNIPLIETIHPADRETVKFQQIQRVKGISTTSNYQHRIVTKDGDIRWIGLKAVNIVWEDKPAHLVFFSNITEKKKSNELLIQAEKMMSLGGLAAGMAHEINNPLGGILQGIQNIERRLSPELKANLTAAREAGIDLEKLQFYLEKRKILSSASGIRESARKAADIIVNMLQFSRRSESKVTYIKLNELLDNVLQLAGNDYDLKKRCDFKSIEVNREFDKTVPPIPCVGMEIEQVMLNLFKNASQAMSDNNQENPPQLTIRLLQEEYMARIEVQDNGPGIDASIRSRVFEPFFTTKPVGIGTGLGLSISYMIITNNHNGTLEVGDDVNRGTRFIIRLPLEADT